MTGYMADGPVPDADHVARHLANRHVHEGVIGSAAFLLEQGHDYVSVFHMEFFVTVTQPEQLSCICSHLDDACRRKLEGGRKIGNSNRFAVLNSGDAKRAVLESAEERVSLRIEKKPVPGALFHSSLKGYGMDGDGDLAAAALKGIAALSETRRELPAADSCDCSVRSGR